ncbi:MAG: protein kinase [Planctomycetota bacterium]
MSAEAEQTAIEHALRRGFLDPAGLQGARQEMQRAGQGSLLPFLRGRLQPAQLEELRQVYQQALSGGHTTTRTSASSVQTVSAAPAGSARFGGAGGLPAMIGRYPVERELARGGMGVVYVVRHPLLERSMALKMMLEGFEGGLAAQRFVREARATARLRHPGIVQVHDVDQHEGRPFYVMDLVEGSTLKELLKREGPLEPRRAAGLIAQVADALEVAHEQGVLHRDIKPDNVLLDVEGAPRITDFGIARDQGDDAQQLTKTGDLLGTPAYMPPEQADGNRRAMGRPSDVYALGATLFALLTGRPPFVGSSALVTIQQVLTDPPPRPSSLRPGIDPELEDVVLRCLEKEPEARYATAAELAADLRAYLTAAAAPRGGAPLAVLAAVAAIPLVVGGLWLARRSQPAPAPSTASASPSAPSPSSSPGPSDQKREEPQAPSPAPSSTVSPSPSPSPSPTRAPGRRPAALPTLRPQPNAADWVEVTPPPGAPWPSERDGHERAMVWDSHRKRVLLFGGWNGKYWFGDLWAWTGKEWQLLQRTGAPGAPPGRFAHALAFDEGRRRLVLYGGVRSGHADQLHADLWEWDGTAWEEKHPAGGGPGPRGWHAMAYVPGTGIVLFGGTSRSAIGHAPRNQGDLWAWNGERWRELTPSDEGVRPPPRMEPALAYDPLRQRLVLTGGTADVWEWEGTRWTRFEANPKLARYAAALAFDGKDLVLSCGQSGKRQGTSLRWNGAQWLIRLSRRYPAPRMYHAMCWDPEREQLVVFGGDLGGRRGGDLWLSSTRPLPGAR